MFRICFGMKIRKLQLFWCKQKGYRVVTPANLVHLWLYDTWDGDGNGWDMLRLGLTYIGWRTLRTSNSRFEGIFRPSWHFGLAFLCHGWSPEMDGTWFNVRVSKTSHQGVNLGNLCGGLKNSCRFIMNTNHQPETMDFAREFTQIWIGVGLIAVPAEKKHSCVGMAQHQLGTIWMEWIPITTY